MRGKCASRLKGFKEKWRSCMAHWLLRKNSCIAWRWICTPHPDSLHGGLIISERRLSLLKEVMSTRVLSIAHPSTQWRLATSSLSASTLQETTTRTSCPSTSWSWKEDLTRYCNGPSSDESISVCSTPSEWVSFPCVNDHRYLWYRFGVGEGSCSNYMYLRYTSGGHCVNYRYLWYISWGGGGGGWGIQVYLVYWTGKGSSGVVSY